MKILVTGGAGFIGSNLVERLVEGNEVIVIDDLSGGKLEFLNPIINKIKFHKIDLEGDIFKLFEGVEEVWHLAANPDVRNSNVDTYFKDLRVTKNVLEACAEKNVKRIFFTSSSTVYGVAELNTPETAETKPISFYGAMKLSCESLLFAYCSMSQIKCFSFRLANIIGKNSTHGAIFDFANKLLKNQEELEILGDGTQTKSYLHVDDCIDAMLIAKNKSKEKLNILNIGNIDQTNVEEIAEIVIKEMTKSGKIEGEPKINFTGGVLGAGWAGDVKEMLLDISKISKMDFEPKLKSNEAIAKATKETINSL